MFVDTLAPAKIETLKTFTGTLDITETCILNGH